MNAGNTSYRISLERGTLRFAAAHVATFRNDCEPLHGHNYAVTIELGGSLTADESWILDFSEARRIARSICRELDHKFILQTKSRALSIEQDDEVYHIGFGQRHYVMPASDVAPLPIGNSTAERLAEWFAGRFASGLEALGATNIASVTVGVEEAPGQTGWFTVQILPRRESGEKG